LAIARIPALKTIPEVSVRLVKEREVPYDGVHLCKADTVAQFLRHAEELDREHFFVLLLNARKKLVAYSVVSIGTLDSVIVNPREVFKAAILHNAHSVVVAHNHPSSDPCPSESDIDTTRRLIDAGRILGIPVVDHVVLGEKGSFVSIRESLPGFFC
jgi:DNA repair protein RadC